MSVPNQPSSWLRTLKLGLMKQAEGVTEQLKAKNQMEWGAGVRWTPLPKAETPTEPTGETAA